MKIVLDHESVSVSESVSYATRAAILGLSDDDTVVWEWSKATSFSPKCAASRESRAINYMLN